jgi:hypothetical protein
MNLDPLFVDLLLNPEVIDFEMFVLEMDSTLKTIVAALELSQNTGVLKRLKIYLENLKYWQCSSSFRNPF